MDLRMEDPSHNHEYIRNQLVMECPRCQILTRIVVQLWAGEWFRRDKHFMDPTDANILNLVQMECGKKIQPELLPLIREEITSRPDRKIRALIHQLEIKTGKRR